MMRTRERDRRYKRMVGLLVIASALAVLIFLGAHQRATRPFKSTINLTALTSRADGLGEDTPVTLAGLRIGKLGALNLTADNQVALTLELDAGLADKLRTDSRATIVRPLIGSAFIDIHPGSPAQPLLKTGDVLASGVEADLNSLLATVPARLEKLDRALDNINAVTADLKQVSHRLAQPRGPLTQAMENGALAAGKLNRQLDSVGRILKQTEQASHQVNEIVSELGQDAKRVGPILGQVERTLAHGEGLAGELRQQGPLLGQALERGTETLHDTDDLVRAAQQNFLLRGNLPPPAEAPPLTPSRGRLP